MYISGLLKTKKVDIQDGKVDIGTVLLEKGKYGVEKVILFGSRARGDYKERSDIDLAFRGGDSSRFILDIDETTSTLLEFDVIDLDKPVRTELLDSISREGIVIYEKIWKL